MLTPLVQKQIDERAERRGIAVEQAKADLLGEKQPSGEFATPEQIGALCVFLCSDARPRSAARRCRWMAAGWPNNIHYKESLCELSLLPTRWR